MKTHSACFTSSFEFQKTTCENGLSKGYPIEADSIPIPQKEENTRGEHRRRLSVQNAKHAYMICLENANLFEIADFVGKGF